MKGDRSADFHSDSRSSQAESNKALKWGSTSYHSAISTSFFPPPSLRVWQVRARSLRAR